MVKNVNIESMENQEIPKKLTLEEIEKQEKNLEQQEETKENPVEEDSSVRLSDINENITKKEENIQNTQNKINDIRGQLGLPPSDEIPPSIKNDQDSIEKLKQEKESLNYPLIEKNLDDIAKEKQEINDRFVFNPDKKMFEFSSKDDEERYRKLEKLQSAAFNGNLGELNKVDILNKNSEQKDNVFKSQEKEKSEETKLFEKNLKGVIDNISSDSKTMLDALNERQQNHLTPIQSNDQFRMMASNIRNLKSFESKIDIESVSEIITNIGKLSRMFDEFRIQQTSQIKENTENLEKLSFGAKRFSGSVQENFRKLPIEMEDKQMEAKSKELRLAMQKLSEQSQKLWMFAVKMRENSR